MRHLVVDDEVGPREQMADDREVGEVAADEDHAVEGDGRDTSHFRREIETDRRKHVIGDEDLDQERRAAHEADDDGDECVDRSDLQRADDGQAGAEHKGEQHDDDSQPNVDGRRTDQTGQDRQQIVELEAHGTGLSCRKMPGLAVIPLVTASRGYIAPGGR